MYYFVLIKIVIHTPDLGEAKRGALIFANTQFRFTFGQVIFMSNDAR